MRRTVTSSRTVKVDNIVGLTEIAERTGSSKQTVWSWTSREGFPEPIARVSGRPVWNWPEVSKWNSSWVRSKGGYPTHKANQDA